jgi:hypothetical protein
MVQATLLADAMAEHGDDAVARATEYEAASAREIEPWYHAAVMSDRENRGEVDEGNVMRAVLRDGVAPAMRLDQRVFRAFLRTFNLLTTPDAFMRDGELMTRIIEVYNDRDNRPPEPDLGPPTRAEFLSGL